MLNKIQNVALVPLLSDHLMKIMTVSIVKKIILNIYVQCVEDVYV